MAKYCEIGYTVSSIDFEGKVTEKYFNDYDDAADYFQVQSDAVYDKQIKGCSWDGYDYYNREGWNEDAYGDCEGIH